MAKKAKKESEHKHVFVLFKTGAQSVVACSICGKRPNVVGYIDLKNAVKANQDDKQEQSKSAKVSTTKKSKADK
jgi:hypothetical protein